MHKIKLTEGRLKAAGNGHFSYPQEQLDILGLGLRHPLKKGWKDKIINKRIPNEVFKRFLNYGKKKTNVCTCLKEVPRKSVVISYPIIYSKQEEPKKQLLFNKKVYDGLSQGARSIYLFLCRNKIEFELEKIFPDCINPETQMELRFDFYIPKYNMCIEYDGEQHFRYVPDMHGKSFEDGYRALNKQRNRDQIKTDYCISKGIIIERINFRQKNCIDEVLRGVFKVKNNTISGYKN